MFWLVALGHLALVLLVMLVGSFEVGLVTLAIGIVALLLAGFAVDGLVEFAIGNPFAVFEALASSADHLAAAAEITNDGSRQEGTDDGAWG
ncbi:MAG: hypothetical protein AAGA59_01295 [Actinomycetota bacterium]